jgi:hypothetical protein
MNRGTRLARAHSILVEAHDLAGLAVPERCRLCWAIEQVGADGTLRIPVPLAGSWAHQKELPTFETEPKRE